MMGDSPFHVEPAFAQGTQYYHAIPAAFQSSVAEYYSIASHHHTAVFSVSASTYQCLPMTTTVLNST